MPAGVRWSFYFQPPRSSDASHIAMSINRLSHDDGPPIRICYRRFWLNTFNWSSSGYTVSTTSYKYSNMSGFVQSIINSNGCGVTTDGVFGPLTKSNLATTQSGILGSNNGGVMNAWSWYAFQNAVDTFGYTRLSGSNGVDGYGTQWRGYYGGGASSAALGWNPISAQWLFSQYPNSSPTSLQPATPSRTIGSVAACS